MSKEARSKGACWSCKLRRKRCDETRPTCSACTTSAVPCFGYDLKPAWADGGQKQKAKAEELQLVVREMAALKRRSRKKRLSTQVDELSPDKDSESVVTEKVSIFGTERADDDVTFNDNQPVAPQCQITAALKALDINATVSSQNPTADLLECDSQAYLLMHYLDVVFPSQFPFYNPAPSDGGRGWLLLIIMRTKPLYHAALSMAAYHESLQSCGPLVSRPFNTCAAATLRAHHFLAINELRYHLDSFRQGERAQTLEGNIEVLACIVFLILLEVFLGEPESWQIHLKAAHTLVPGFREGCLRQTDWMESLSPSHRTAYHFFTSVSSWFDILSHATTGMDPQILHACLEEKAGFINLEMVTGCENAVILAISETTNLKQWKGTSQKDGRFSVKDFNCRASEIERTFLNALKECSWAIKRSAEAVSSTTNEQSNQLIAAEAVCGRPQTAAVTRIFACAALVYLNVVVCGPLPDHPKIHESVSQVISALKELENRSALGMLAWPLCVAGSIASGWQVEYFRCLFMDLRDVSDLKLGNLERSFSIVEECWRLRRDPMESPDWQRAMESRHTQILLI